VLIKELELILDSCTLELTPVDEVLPNLYIGNAVAQNKKTLNKLGITHVLNAAHSKQGSIGDQGYYGNTCVYFGIPAEDSDHFDLSQYFKPAADFIHKALKKVLVHCIMGMSRSATSEARHQKTSHLSQPALPVPPPQARAANTQTEAVSSSL
uniref:Dual specificity protein phosphatase n=1 Tax=Monopterus albus TaxID=43700 RepID=A0A3Q3JP84_MONAL